MFVQPSFTSLVSIPPSLTLSMVYSVLQIRRAKVAGVDTNDETEQGDEISTKDCGLPGNHAPPSTRQRPAFEGLISSPATWLESSSLPSNTHTPYPSKGTQLDEQKDFKLLGAALTSHIPETRKFHLTTINFAYLIFGKHVYIYDAINVTMLHRKRIHKHRMILTWYHRNCRCKALNSVLCCLYTAFINLLHLFIFINDTTSRKTKHPQVSVLTLTIYSALRSYQDMRRTPSSPRYYFYYYFFFNGTNVKCHNLLFGVAALRSRTHNLLKSPSHIHISFNACLPNLIRPGGGVRVIWRAELLFKVGLNGGTVRPTRPTCDLGKADQINNNLSFEITSCRHLFKTSLPI